MGNVAGRAWVQPVFVSRLAEVVKSRILVRAIRSSRADIRDFSAQYWPIAFFIKSTHRVERLRTHRPINSYGPNTQALKFIYRETIDHIIDASLHDAGPSGIAMPEQGIGDGRGGPRVGDGVKRRTAADGPKSAVGIELVKHRPLLDGEIGGACDAFEARHLGRLRFIERPSNSAPKAHFISISISSALRGRNDLRPPGSTLASSSGTPFPRNTPFALHVTPRPSARSR
jgi:hypothetical protein